MSTSQIPTLSSFSLPSKAIEALSTKLDTVNRQTTAKQAELVRAKTSLQDSKRRLQYYSNSNPSAGTTGAQVKPGESSRRERDRQQWSLRVKAAEGKVVAVEGELKKLGDVTAEVMRRLQSARKMQERQRR